MDHLGTSFRIFKHPFIKVLRKTMMYIDGCHGLAFQVLGTLEKNPTHK